MYNILILNGGSSSLKFKLFKYNNSFEVITSGQFSKTNSDSPNFIININDQKISKNFNQKLDMETILNILNKEIHTYFGDIKINAIGHRVVHGGEKHTQPTLVTQELINNLKQITYLTPIHMPHNIAPMEVCNKIFKDIPQVACFDTSFHSTIDSMHTTYAIPRDLTENEKIKRYGFHGLSYEYIIGKFAETNPKLAERKIIIAHLGAGASLCALKNKKSIDTTMGLTPLEGLVMGTRCGSIDPSIVLYLINKGLNYNEITDILYFKSGLLGVSTISPDFATISSLENPKAKEAYKLFINSITKNILALAATLKGIDAIIFSGGIGENSYKLRADVLNNLDWLGVKLNPEANNKHTFNITQPGSKIQSFIVPTQEELIIAQHTTSLLNFK